MKKRMEDHQNGMTGKRRKENGDFLCWRRKDRRRRWRKQKKENEFKFHKGKRKWWKYWRSGVNGMIIIGWKQENGIESSESRSQKCICQEGQEEEEGYEQRPTDDRPNQLHFSSCNLTHFHFSHDTQSHLLFLLLGFLYFFIQGVSTPCITFITQTERERERETSVQVDVASLDTYLFYYLSLFLFLYSHFISSACSWKWSKVKIL